MATMTKAELLESVTSSSGVSRSQAETVLSSFFSTVVQGAKRGDKVGWPGFGTFSATKRGARTGRNPRTGAPVKIAASTALKFNASSTLKQEMNTKKAAKKATAAKSTAKASKTSASKTSATKAKATKATKAPAKAAKSTAKSTKSTAKKASGTKKS